MLTWGVFVELADPPRDTGLSPLTVGATTRERAVDGFKRFLDPTRWTSAPVDQIGDRSTPGVIYLFGHAWLEGGIYTVASATGVKLNGSQLLAQLCAQCSGPVLLIVDTCHADALRDALKTRRPTGWTVLFASSAIESAFSIAGAGSRLSLALASAARRLKRRTSLDALDLYQAARDQLRRSDVIAAQSGSCWVGGDPLVLVSRLDTASGMLPRPHVWLRAAFLGAGGVLAAAAIATAWYYYSHQLIEIRIPAGVVAMTDSARIRIHRPNLDAGTETLLRAVDVPLSGVLNVRVSAGNSILRFQARYRDGAERALNLHVVTQPSWAPNGKRIRWTLPDESQIAAHRDMAYVPAVSWLEGVAREPTEQVYGFWIDLHPPRTAEYLEWLRLAAASGEIDPARSQIGATRAQLGGLAATGLDQTLLQLMNDLAPAMSQIDETVRRDRSQSEPTSAELPHLEESCEQCPALMTRDEADLYCRSRDMRVSTRSEWQLAVRGVDGRAYPWGERHVDGRSQVIGLPEKDQPYELAPVDAFREFESPFGLWDTVGNAGDWVDTEGGYPRAFAGGNYRFNPEDATVVSLLPDTGEFTPVWPNTARCVADGRLLDSANW